MEKTIEIPEGYEARIKGNKVIIELKESEDERIRKELLEEIEFIIPHDDETDSEGLILPSYHARIDRYKSYLEKQKEQNPVDIAPNQFDGITYRMQGHLTEKPAEWSEEFLRLMGITISQDGNQVCVLLGENLAEGIAGFGDTLADAVEEFKKEWRQFDRFRKTTWKPSEEQINALQAFVGMIHPDARYNAVSSLLDELKAL